MKKIYEIRGKIGAMVFKYIPPDGHVKKTSYMVFTEIEHIIRRSLENMAPFRIIQSRRTVVLKGTH